MCVFTFFVACFFFCHCWRIFSLLKVKRLKQINEWGWSCYFINRFRKCTCNWKLLQFFLYVPLQGRIFANFKNVYSWLSLIPIPRRRDFCSNYREIRIVESLSYSNFQTWRVTIRIREINREFWKIRKNIKGFTQKYVCSTGEGAGVESCIWRNTKCLSNYFISFSFDYFHESFILGLKFSYLHRVA